MHRAAQTLAVAFPSHTPRSMTGDVELGVAAALASGRRRPDAVTAVLVHVFSEIGGLATEIGDVWRLASGSREWLLQRAAALFWHDAGWFQARCAHCDAAYDLPLKLASAPRKPAGRPFPTVTVRTSLGARQFEVPNGLHEADLAKDSPHAPERRLVALCGLGRDAQADADGFTEGDLRVIEDALDAAAPDVADEASIICPACKTSTVARIDPLDFAFPDMQGILRDVHALASRYHWSEDAILSLPSARRRAYVRLIGQEARR
ncbi:hypothetical protein J7413_14390 [Shimia sp. R10_1]|uniref:hypothetical protein n=1 Tax=Shimia sp. R10_1 TaxID=2821095 RepID=UPI001ADC75C1|nr:hypothetical protein [Shimia sp. R10_1]MBO9474735.1 hypothetical protein [Shimia sp. R10_1]